MRWGLIGASTIASQYMINAIKQQHGHEIKTVLSSSAGRAKEYSITHGIACHTDNLGQLLADEEIGAVYISTTNEKHKDQALAAIAAGKHVMCEKPLAMSVEDALYMVKEAEDAGVVFATNHHLRNAGSHIKIKQLIQNGTLGTIQSIRVFHAVFLPQNLQGWRINNAAAGGGVIPDITTHDADTVRFYLEEDPFLVTSLERSSYLSDGVEDSAMSIWSMPSGVMVQTHDSFTHEFAGNGIEVHGTKASIIARNVMSQQPVGEITLVDKNGSNAVKYDKHDLYIHSMKQFVKALNGEGAPSATGIDGVKSLAVAAAVKKSAVGGVAVKVNYGGLS